MQTTSLEVRSDDASIHVQDTGRGDPFVLVHGYTGSSIDWVDVVEPLAADGRRIVTFDHRGHGASTNTGDAGTYTIDQLARDLAAVVDALGLESFDLLGHSMGGVVAMKYCLARHSRVRSLVLMDTSARPMGGLPLEAIEGLSGLGQERGMGAVFELVREFFDGSASGVETGASPEQQVILRARLEEKFGQLDPVAFGSLARELSEGDSMLESIRGFEMPVTVLVGALDKGLVPAAREMAEAIPQARHVVIENAGHCPQEDRPQEWLASIREHLADR